MKNRQKEEYFKNESLVLDQNVTYIIKSLNLLRPFSLTSTEYGKAIISNNPSNQYPTKWFYSQNNSFHRQKIFEFTNNTTHIKKLDTELAVFAGNLFRLILGDDHPHYYLCAIENYQHFKLEHPYVRACNKVNDFVEWDKCVEVIDDKIINVFNVTYHFDDIDKIGIKGLTAILVVGYFLNEEDWNGMNFGIIKNNLSVVRIDPGLSFGEKFFNESSTDIHHTLNNLLFNYIFTIDNENYLSEFRINNDECDNSQSDSENENIENTKLIHEKIEILFNSKDELFATLSKIISLPISAYQNQAKQDFSCENFGIADKLINYIHERIKKFYFAACKLKGFREYYDNHIKENTIISTDSFVKNSKLFQQKESKFKNFYSYFEKNNVESRKKKYNDIVYFENKQSYLNNQYYFSELSKMFAPQINTNDFQSDKNFYSSAKQKKIKYGKKKEKLHSASEIEYDFPELSKFFNKN